MGGGLQEKLRCETWIKISSPLQFITACSFLFFGKISSCRPLIISSFIFPVSCGFRPTRLVRGQVRFQLSETLLLNYMLAFIIYHVYTYDYLQI